jgi:hypothetical protein
MATSSHPRPHRGRNRLRPLVWGGATALLLLPAIAMRFTSEVNWDALDFIAMGAMLGIACGLYELAAWLSGNPAYRAAFGIAVVTGLLTVWVNLAVGMFGSEGNPVNLLFGGVLLVAAATALIARFRAARMAWAMGVTAAAQLFAVAIGLAYVLAAGGDEPRAPSVYYEAFLSTCFAVPWLASSMAFRVAARQDAADGGST